MTICLLIRMKQDIDLGSGMMKDFLEKTNEHFAFFKAPGTGKLWFQAELCVQ